MSEIYIVQSFEDTLEHGTLYEIVRIFTKRADVDDFMLSQEWKPSGFFSFEGWQLPFTASRIVYDTDGTILTNEELDYSEHAPPTPEQIGKGKSCGEYLKKLMENNI